MLDEKNVLKSEFDELIFDAGRDGLVELPSNKMQGRVKPNIAVQEIWEWLFQFPLRKRRRTTVTTTTTTSTTEAPLSDDYVASIGRKRRPLKYNRTCECINTKKNRIKIYFLPLDSCQSPPKKHSEF